jgi:hypothetical protein
MLLVKRQSSLPAGNAGHLNKLLNLEAAMLAEGGFKAGSQEAEDRTKHYHCEGTYLRSYHMAKGETCTGEIHRFACINILLQGKVLVVQSDGQYEMEAPHIYISEPGEKKALHALEDTIFCNVHATEETDQDKLRAHFTVPSQEFLLEEK